MITGPLEIAIATAADLRYVVDRQRRWSNQVGFIRRSNLEQLVARQTVWIPTINGQPAGAIVASGGRRSSLCLRSNMVEAELWENGLGTAFCRWLQQHPFSARWGGYRVLTRRDLHRQVAINTGLAGAIVRTRAPGARGHAVDQWWLPSKTPAEGKPQQT